MNEETTETAGHEFEWAIVEIMGHRKHAGRMREEERFGAKMLRVDVPTLLVMHPEKEGDQPTFCVEKWTTHWYGGPSIFSFTLTDEESVMRMNRPYYSPQRYIAPPDPDFGEIEDEEPVF
jgi:hypothetical protein